MADRLDIPDAAFQPKADYFERPPRELIGVILQFIERFGTPHLWPGHTHTKPQKGARVSFLAKYSLPKSHQVPDRWAPCPCCSPHHPKYFHQGLIAWFPDEGLIRCVGDKCYKKMDPEGYALAMNQLNAEIAAERTAAFLLSRIPRIPDYVRVLQYNLPIIEAIDTMLNQLNYVLDKRFAIDLWPEVKTGVLRYTVFRTEVRRGRSGDEIHTFADFETYGAIVGYRALRTSTSRLATKLRQRIDNLQAIDFGDDTTGRIATMTETEKKRVVKVLSWAHGQATKICADAEQVRSFFTKANMATINGWSQLEAAPVRVHFSLEDEAFHIGRASNQAHSQLPWPEKFWHQIQQIEPLTRGKAA